MKTSTASIVPSSNPSTKAQLLASLKPMVVTIDGVTVGVAYPKEFSTGSIGLHLNGKVTINGMTFQGNVLLTVPNSKKL